MRLQGRHERRVVALSVILLATAHWGCRRHWVEADATKPLPVDPALREGRTAGGMRYLLLPVRQQADRVVVRMVVGVGRVDEEPDEHGLAHFVEHMAFAGSANFPAGELMPFLRSLGLEVGRDANATTGTHHTVYTLSVPARNSQLLQRAMLCLGDFARRLNFETDAVARERSVLLAERRDQARAILVDTTAFALDFAGSRIAERMTAPNDEAVVQSASADAVRAFHRKWYRPDTTTLVVAGDVDLAEVARMIEADFGDWRAQGPAPAARVTLPEPTSPRAAAVADLEVNRAEVYLRSSRPVEPVAMLGAYRREVVDGLATGFLHDRLSRRMSQATLQPAEARVFQDRWPFGAVTYSAMVSGPVGHWKAIASTLLQEVESARASGLDRSDLSRGRRTLSKRMESRIAQPDSPDVAARRLVEAVIEGRAPMSPAQELTLWRDLAEGITAKEVNNVLWEAFNPAKRRVLVRLPGGHSPLPSQSELLDVRPGTTDPTSVTSTPTWAPARLDGNPSLAKVVERSIEPLDVLAIRLANQVRVNLRTVPDAQRVVLSILLAGGELEEAGARQGMTRAAAAAALSEPAVGKVPWAGVRQYLERQGITLSARAHSDALMLRVSAPPARLEEALNVAYRVLTEMEAEPSAIERWKAEQTRTMGSGSLDESVRRRLRSVVSGDAGTPLAAASIAKLTANDVTRWLHQQVAAVPLEAALVGPLSTERLMESAALYLGALGSRSPVTTRRQASASDTVGLRIKQTIREPTLDRNAAVLLAWPTPNADRDRAERRHVRLAARIIGQRLRSQLREQRGLSYQVTCTVANMRGTREGLTLYALFTVAPERAEEAVMAARQVIALLGKDGPTEAEVRNAQDELTRDFRRVYQSPEQWASLLEGRLLRGEDLADVRQSLAGERVDGSRLRETMRSLFATGDPIEITGLPAS